MVPIDELADGGRARRGARVVRWLVVAAVAGTAIALAFRPASEPRVPDFELPVLGGGTMSSEDLKGSPVVLNFFASWCAPCREEAPVLQEAWERYRDEGVRFVGVNVQDTAAGARAFVREFGITYPVVRDADQDVAEDLRVYGLPQTFFVTDEWTLHGAEAGDTVGASEGGRPLQLGAIAPRALERRVEDLIAASDEG